MLKFLFLRLELLSYLLLLSYLAFFSLESARIIHGKKCFNIRLVALSFMIYGAITFERKAGCITPLFTGRGLLWDAGTEKILHPDSNVYFFRNSFNFC